MKTDFTGETIYNWKVLKFDSYGYAASEKWQCECVCGNIRIVTGRELRTGRRRSCGCKIPIGKIPEIGNKFGMLTVISESEIQKSGQGQIYKCMCDCGNITELPRFVLVNEITKSCGCLQVKSITTIGGLSKRPEYSCWQAMKSRCTNPNDRGYKYYGGRGIKVCDRWQNFVDFFEDVGPRPHPEYSLDRIDSDGNYEPGNVRWATPEEQWENRKKRGVTLSTLQFKLRNLNKPHYRYDLSELSKDELIEHAIDFFKNLTLECDKHNIQLDSIGMKAIKEI